MHDTYEPSRLLEVMTHVARKCGKMMLNADVEHAAAREKTSRRDLLTAYDVKIQEFAVRELSSAFPDARFICEESDANTAADDGVTFIIDPIDGTANFVHRIGHSCTSIGCTKNARPIAAAVYDVYKDELFTAEMGKGAFLNGEAIHVFSGALADSIVMFGTSPYNMDYADETFDRVRSIFGRCQDVRRSGSAALDLCYAAAGRVGLFFESELSLWDYAAGALIVEEAGGVFLTLEGKAMTYDRPHKISGIAGSRQIIKESGFLP